MILDAGLEEALRERRRLREAPDRSILTVNALCCYTDGQGRSCDRCKGCEKVEWRFLLSQWLLDVRFPGAARQLARRRQDFAGRAPQLKLAILRMIDRELEGFEPFRFSFITNT